MDEVFICQTCYMQFDTFKRYWNHMRYNHEIHGSFSVTCKINSCTSKYSSLKSYYKHLQRKHCNFHLRHFTASRNNDGFLATEEVDVNSDLPEAEGLLMDETDISEMNVDGDEYGMLESSVDIEDVIAHFLLELREIKKVSGEACSFVASQLYKIVDSALVNQNNRILKRLDELLIRDTDLIKLVSTPDKSLENACKKFETVKNLDYYIAAKSGDFLVKPKEIVLDWCTERGMYDTIQYVPIRETLNVILGKEDVASHVLKSKEEKGDIEKFSDGSIYKQDDFFKSLLYPLEIIVYSDDFVPVNPLGHKQRNYKMTAFYFVLGNIPRKYRSCLKNVNLLLLSPAKFVHKYGYEKILKPLISDLMLLETEGITLMVDNAAVTLYGTVSLLIGDNLGAHAIGGFMESFGPNINKVCRYCEGERCDIRVLFEGSNFAKRTANSYKEQLKLVEFDHSYTSLYGLKSDSPFNKLNYFHVVSRQPFDIFHDIFEGLGVEVISNITRHFIRNDVFDLNCFNNRIDKFCFLANEKTDKPQHLYKGKSTSWDNFRVHQKAVEMSNLIRNYPLLVGHLVPENDEVWRILIDFVQLVQYLTAEKFHGGEVIVLRTMIEEFLMSYYNYFHLQATPKGHFLVHYPDQILEVGPPVDHSTVRFEAKHNYFKEIYNRSNNRRNVQKTMAVRHQYFMYLHYRNRFLLDPEEPHTSYDENVDITTLDSAISAKLRELTDNREVILFRKIKYEGNIYSTGEAVVLNFRFDVLQFGLIYGMFLIGDVLYFICHSLSTLGFNSHFNSYEVIVGTEYSITCIKNLLDNDPLGVHDVPGLQDCNLVTLKKYIRVD